MNFKFLLILVSTLFHQFGFKHFQVYYMDLQVLIALLIMELDARKPRRKGKKGHRRPKGHHHHHKGHKGKGVGIGFSKGFSFQLGHLSEGKGGGGGDGWGWRLPKVKLIKPKIKFLPWRLKILRPKLIVKGPKLKFYRR